MNDPDAPREPGAREEPAETSTPLGGDGRAESAASAQPGGDGRAERGAARGGDGRAGAAAAGLDQPPERAGTPAAGRIAKPSATRLLRDLVDDVAVLFRKELALAAAEINQSVDAAKTGAVSMVSGGAVLYAGLLFLLAAATAALALVMPGWAAALIVGGVVTLIGLIMVQSGRKRLEAGSFAPHRATDAMRKDREAIRRHAHERDEREYPTGHPQGSA